MIFIKALFCLILCSPYVSGLKAPDIIFVYGRYRYDVIYAKEINNTMEIVMAFDGNKEVFDTPARVIVKSPESSKTYPLFVTARQQKGVSSWQLPMLVQTRNGSVQFNEVARTLCPHNNLYSERYDVCDKLANVPVIHLTTSSPENITFDISLKGVEDFYIPLEKETEVHVTPSKPQYYFYPFKDSGPGLQEFKDMMHLKTSKCKSKTQDQELSNMYDLSAVDRLKFSKEVRVDGERTGVEDKPSYVNVSSLHKPKNVIIDITSDSDICAIISIQNASCPVFDNERDILYDGYYLTMTRRGGITLSQDLFPNGFYIVFIVKSSDEECLGRELNLNKTVPFLWKSRDLYDGSVNDDRSKTFRFTITETISYVDYISASLAVLGFFLLFYLAVLLIILCQGTRNLVLRAQPSSCDSGATEGSPLSGSDVGNSTPVPPTGLLVQVSVDGSAARQVAETNLIPRKQSSSSDSDSDNSALRGALDVRVNTPISSSPRVDDLCRKRQRVISNRSKMYLWNVLIVTVFYTLPVIQLVITYQKMLNQSGDQDLCYYNFLCAHPLLMLSDFNHVYSNIGYVLLGVLFLLLVWMRHQLYKRKPRAQKELGIPQHFGLLYAMAVALISEGLLSASYHVCPNSMNFQFDTSFMYITSVMCMIKIYQNRHPDVNARAHATFGVLALIIFIGLIGVLNANIYFWVAFTFLHLGTCLVMSIQIYYMGRFRLERTMISRAARELMRHPIVAMKPIYLGRMVLLFIANVANWFIAAYGMYQHEADFASHLLIILMSNLSLYTLFYIVMKLLNKERIVWYSWVFIALSYTFWFVSGYFFVDKGTDWSETPALSRANNKFCMLMQLYDSHDIWHFLSAVAMFFSFNMYLTLDDNLANTPRTEIMVF